MWEVNRLNNSKFYADTSGFTIDDPGVRDIDNLFQGVCSLYFNLKDLVVDSNKGFENSPLLVHPGEIYSSSLYCKVSDYNLFDGSDPQVSLILYGSDINKENKVILASIGCNKQNFPANDWFRLKIENIVIPSDIHYLSLRTNISRNGEVWFAYPCIEFGTTVTDFNPYNSNLMDYYDTIVYNGIVEANEIVKTQNIAFDELDAVTTKTQSRFYVLTCDEEGISYYEDQLKIIPDPINETLEFRRQRVLNRFSSIIPFTFPFLQQKLDSVIGVNKYNAWIDFNKYILYIESAADNQSWYQEIRITLARIKPCNMVFISTPLVKSTLSITEQVSAATAKYNYPLDGTWQLDGAFPFRSVGNMGVIKMSNQPSIQQNLLNQAATFVSNKIQSVRINDSINITDFEIKSAINNMVTLEYQVAEVQTNLVTNIKLIDIVGNILTNTPVFCPVTDNALFQHSIPIQEVI